jgi:hypothetical protein
VIRALLLSGLVLASVFACEDANDSGETAGEGPSAVERAQREAARKVERAGEALREATADGSLLVQSPAPPDAGD